MRKGDKVTLAWTVPTVTMDRQTVRSLGATRICRGLEAKLTECGNAVGEAPPEPARSKPPGKKIAGSYIDALPGAMRTANSSGFATYAVEVLNADGRGAGLSNQVRVSLAGTLPPPRDFSARVRSQGVVLSWISEAPVPATEGVRYVYRVYRRLEGTQQQVLAGEAPAGSENSFTFTDSNIEWEKTYEYHAEAVTVISQANKSEVQVEGDDSPEVKVVADDVFPPAVPAGLQAVFSGPGQQAFIDLIWAPVTDADFDGYNVYRHEEGAAAVRLNVELVKAPAYRDGAVVSGKHYLYSITAVDVRGNESARSEEAGESVP
jgi:hypothetical protein